MCYTVYVGSRDALPMRDTANWVALDKTQNDWPLRVPPICVSEVCAEEVGVKEKFDEAHVVMVGSYQGCGCGFCEPCGQLPNSVELTDSDYELAAALGSRVALADYIRKHNVTTLYGCWIGDDAAPVEHDLEVTLDQIIDPAFEFLERCRMRVVPSPCSA